MVESSTASGIPLQAPPPPPPPPKKIFGKKLIIAIGLIAVVAVASVFAFIYLMPKGLGATVSLGINYNVGEKMTYQVDITMSVMGQTISQNGTISMEVLSFDGVNYTIRERAHFPPQEYTFTLKMNKTGYITDYSGLPAEIQQTYSSFVGMPGFGSYFPKLKAKVGESWQIPMNIGAGEFSINGTVNYGISGVANVTVPSGTYEVYRMDVTAANVHGTYESAGTTANIILSISAYGYMENATGYLIEFNIQESVNVTAMGQSMDMSMTILVRLTEHIGH